MQKAPATFNVEVTLHLSVPKSARPSAFARRLARRGVAALQRYRAGAAVATAQVCIVVPGLFPYGWPQRKLQARSQAVVNVPQRELKALAVKVAKGVKRHGAIVLEDGSGIELAARRFHYTVPIRVTWSKAARRALRARRQISPTSRCALSLVLGPMRGRMKMNLPVPVPRGARVLRVSALRLYFAPEGKLLFGRLPKRGSGGGQNPPTLADFEI